MKLVIRRERERDETGEMNDFEKEKGGGGCFIGWRGRKLRKVHFM